MKNLNVKFMDPLWFVGISGAALLFTVIVVVVVATRTTEEEKLCEDNWNYHIQIVEHENYAIWNDDENAGHFYRDYVEYGKGAHMNSCPNWHPMEINEYNDALIENLDELEQIR